MGNTEHAYDDGPGAVATLLANQRRFLDFLVARVGNSADAEEILQAAFVRSLEKAESLRDSESAVAWFYRLLRTAVIDHYRKGASRNRAIDAFAQQLAEPETAPDADMERVVCQCIEELVPLLEPKHAEMIERIDLGGSDITTAANALGITPGNARVRLHRARSALRRAVEQACRTCAEHGCTDCTCGSTSRAE
jgi:RNA polymerase sigma-70 factor (ECF subfamily)